MSENKHILYAPIRQKYINSATKKNIFITLVTTYGINKNQYSNELVQNELKMDSLFNE